MLDTDWVAELPLLLEELELDDELELLLLELDELLEELDELEVAT